MIEPDDELLKLTVSGPGPEVGIPLNCASGDGAGADTAREWVRVCGVLPPGPETGRRRGAGADAYTLPALRFGSVQAAGIHDVDHEDFLTILTIGSA